MGIFLCQLIIRPGVGSGCEPTYVTKNGTFENVTCKLDDKPNARHVTTADTLMDLIRNVFPPNLIEACIRQSKTVLIYPDTEKKEEITQLDECEKVEDCKTEWEFKNAKGDSMNILGMYLCILLDRSGAYLTFCNVVRMSEILTKCENF